jgi:hypothetical protein
MRYTRHKYHTKYGGDNTFETKTAINQFMKILDKYKFDEKTLEELRKKNENKNTKIGEIVNNQRNENNQKEIETAKDINVLNNITKKQNKEEQEKEEQEKKLVKNAATALVSNLPGIGPSINTAKTAYKSIYNQDFVTIGNSTDAKELLKKFLDSFDRAFVYKNKELLSNTKIQIGKKLKELVEAVKILEKFNTEFVSFITNFKNKFLLTNKLDRDIAEYLKKSNLQDILKGMLTQHKIEYLEPILTTYSKFLVEDNFKKFKAYQTFIECFTANYSTEAVKTKEIYKNCITDCINNLKIDGFFSNPQKNEYTFDLKINIDTINAEFRKIIQNIGLYDLYMDLYVYDNDNKGEYETSWGSSGKEIDKFLIAIGAVPTIPRDKIQIHKYTDINVDFFRSALSDEQNAYHQKGFSTRVYYDPTATAYDIFNIEATGVENFMALLKKHQELQLISDNDTEKQGEREKLEKYFKKIYRKTLKVSEMIDPINRELRNQQITEKKNEGTPPL